MVFEAKYPIAGFDDIKKYELKESLVDFLAPLVFNVGSSSTGGAKQRAAQRVCRLKASR